MKELTFNRFLLYKPKSNYTYIRKLSMSYGYYTALAVVNDSSHITHIGLSNSFQIIPFKRISEEDAKILGTEKCNELEPDDLLSIYRINRALKLDWSFRLHKPYRNMRYTTLDETNELKRLIRHTLKYNNLVIKDNPTERYDTPYTDQVEFDLWNLDLSTIEDSGKNIPTFDKKGAAGQTKLV